jgi:hypothetical protein
MATQPWSDRPFTSTKAWSDHIAALVVDALVGGGVVGHDDFEKAEAIVSEEISARLCVLDYPPTEEPRSSSSDA